MSCCVACAAGGNTRCSSAGSIAQSPVWVLLAESRWLLMARRIVDLETPVALAACPSDAYMPVHPCCVACQAACHGLVKGALPRPSCAKIGSRSRNPTL
jgi:hypothetical protein